MALQRWRRRRPAGEGDATVEGVDPAAAPDGTAEEDTTSDVLVDDGIEGDLEGDVEGYAEGDLEEEAYLEDEDAAAYVDEDHDDHDDHDGVSDREPADDEVPAEEFVATPSRGGFLAARGWVPLLLFRAAHAKQAVVTALAMGGAAALAGRPAREAGVVLLTVLVGQTILGWHNDIVDKPRDRAHDTPGKPLADGSLEVGTAWYAIIVAALVLVPLSITTGITAGCIYLVSVCVGMLGNVVLRTGFLSWWSWAVSFGMLPAYLSYGGWGGQALGDPPSTTITVLAALLGIGVHFMRSVWGLVADHEDGWTYLPLKLGLKIGATRLLALSTLYTAVIVGLLVVVGVRDGLTG